MSKRGSTADFAAVPANWDAVPLGQLATLSTGGTPSRDRPEYWNGTIPWVKTGEVNYGVIRGTQECITEDGLDNSSARIYPPGTLLVAMYGQGVTRGRAAVLGIHAAINQACAAIVVGDRIDSQFLFFGFMHKYEEVRELGHGANQRNLNMQILRSVEFPVPPHPEQQAIAQVLATVQRAKEATEKVLAATKQLKQSLLRHLFTFGPVPFDQADQVELKETEIGPMPEHWDLTTLDRASQLFQYGTSERCQTEPIGLPVLRIPNVIRDEIDTVELKYLDRQECDAENLLLQTGDLLFVRTNGRREYVGRCAVYDGTPKRALFASYLIRVRPRTELLNSRFIQMYSTTDTGRSQLSGRASGAADGKFNINTQTLRAVVVPLPPTGEQAEIVRMTQAVQQATLAVSQRHRALTTLSNTLLHHLMTGKVRVV